MTIRIDHMPSEYASRVSVVTLETERERALTDTGLMRLCDSFQGIEYVQGKGHYRLTANAFGGAAFGPLPPMGGRVERHGNIATVTIFTITDENEHAERAR